MDSSAVKQFSSIVPETETMCVRNTGDGQTATARSPLRNLKSTRKTTEQVMIRVPPEGTIIPRNQRAQESFWVRQGLQLNYPVVGGRGSLWDQKRAGRLFPATSSEEAGQKAALNLYPCFLFPWDGKATLRGSSPGSVSYCNTLLQMSWLNTIQIDALPVLESEVLMCLPSVGSRRESVPFTCPVSRGCPLSLALSHSTVISRLWVQTHKFVPLPLSVPKGHPHSLACGFFLHLRSHQHSQSSGVVTPAR